MDSAGKKRDLWASFVEDVADPSVKKAPKKPPADADNPWQGEFDRRKSSRDDDSTAPSGPTE